MDQWITFISSHLILFAALVAIVAMLFFSFFGSKLSGFTVTDPSAAIQLINHQNAVILDVREQNEYQSGHILNSVHIPQAYLKDRIGELEKYKDQPIIVGCRTSHRASQACTLLKKAGFESVYNLKGGIMAWQNASLPLVKK